LRQFESRNSETRFREERIMKRILSKVFNPSVKKVSDELRKKFDIYQTTNLKGVTPEEFARHIQSNIGLINAKTEGYAEDEIERQRDLSIKFHWGHDHDFGV